MFDRNEEGSVSLNSFALVTDDPNPEVSAAGHDRTPIVLKPSHMNSWLIIMSAGALGDGAFEFPVLCTFICIQRKPFNFWKPAYLCVHFVFKWIYSYIE